MAASLGAALDPVTAAALREWSVFADLADAQVRRVGLLHQISLQIEGTQRVQVGCRAITSRKGSQQITRAI